MKRKDEFEFKRNFGKLRLIKELCVKRFGKVFAIVNIDLTIGNVLFVILVEPWNKPSISNVIKFLGKQAMQKHMIT